MREENNMENKNEQQVGLKREMGLFGGVGIMAGIVIGSGIFYLGSYVLQRTNMNLGMALVCWVVGGLVSILGGLCFAELGACDPVAGGMVVYLDKAYHPVVGYMYGFTSWLLSGAGSISAGAIALVTTLRTYFPMSDMTVKIVAIVIIIALTAFNCLGIKLGSILSNVSLVAKLIPIVIIIAGALVMGRQSPNLNPVPAGGFEGGFGGALSMIAFATVATLWAYEGWTNANNVAEEIKDPGKNLPRILIFGIGGITILYTVFNFALYKVLPYEEIVSRINSDDLYLGTVVAERVFGGFGGALVLAAMLVAMFGSINGMIIAFARNYYAMAVEGHFFQSYKKIHPKYQVPTHSLIWQAIICSILVLLRNLDQLTNLVVFSGMVFNTLVVLAVIIYRKKYPDLERPYKAWGYPVTIVISVVLFGALMINTLVEDPVTSIIGLVVPAIGAVTYFIFDAKIKKEKAQQ